MTDTLTLARNLEASGLPRQQAEGTVRVLARIKNGDYDIGSDKARIRELEDRVEKLESLMAKVEAHLKLS